LEAVVDAEGVRGGGGGGHGRADRSCGGGRGGVVLCGACGVSVGCGVGVVWLGCGGAPLVWWCAARVVARRSCGGAPLAPCCWSRPGLWHRGEADRGPRPGGAGERAAR